MRYRVQIRQARPGSHWQRGQVIFECNSEAEARHFVASAHLLYSLRRCELTIVEQLQPHRPVALMKAA